MIMGLSGQIYNKYTNRFHLFKLAKNKNRKIQLALEQHRFELPLSTYMCILPPNKQLHSFPSAVGNLWIWRINYIHVSMPFYIGDLRILRFGYLRSPGTNSLQIQWDSLIFKEVKSYRFFIVRGEIKISNPMLFKDQLYYFIIEKNLKAQLFFI